jgi:hypothetical protein
MAFFWACSPGDCFAQDLVLHRLLAEHALQFADLGFQGAIVGRRYDLLTGARGGQRALRHQAAPGE